MTASNVSGAGLLEQSKGRHLRLLLSYDTNIEIMSKKLLPYTWTHDHEEVDSQVPCIRSPLHQGESMQTHWSPDVGPPPLLFRLKTLVLRMYTFGYI